MTDPSDRALDFVAARRESGLSDETMQVLIHLHKTGEGGKLEIAAACGINLTTLPRYLSALVASGHLAKQAAAGDKRGRLFRLSDHGTRLTERLLKHFAPLSADAG